MKLIYGFNVLITLEFFLITSFKVQTVIKLGSCEAQMIHQKGTCYQVPVFFSGVCYVCFMPICGFIQFIAAFVDQYVVVSNLLLFQMTHMWFCAPCINISC
ncbi:hypothetical protein PPACK8108_LOCUS2142 [Phakopsora pachyrhizi]|uniref:Uncharacterized protein n=1 Tax=Phakopsora pachyrhizi TaxID=170000 RepID=A0AAV0AH77_PHAPC|nr:hypothetical protein PPACK8108_LOCUS2142 [Phakopsora pachyrhizi]